MLPPCHSTSKVDHEYYSHRLSRLNLPIENTHITAMILPS
jgi:hypothetical protein